MVYRTFKITGLFLLLAFATACSRPQADKSSVSLSLPSSIGTLGKVGALNTLDLSHLVVYVSGAGVNVPVYIWDQCRNCSTLKPVPSSVKFNDVPTGKSRLFQVLAVYNDSSTNRMVFYYGDVAKDLVESTETAAITVTPVGNANAIVSGNISGRYITSSVAGVDSGPTGTVDIKYSPGGGKPPLIIQYGSIYNGWFNLFALSGAELSYTVRETGDVLWGNPVSTESSSFATNDQVMKMWVPVHKRKFDVSSTTLEQDDASIFLWGYWAGSPAADLTNKKVCRSFISTLTKMKRNDSVSGGTMYDLNLQVASGLPTNAQLLDAVTPYPAIKYTGGFNAFGVSPPSDPCGTNTIAPESPDLFAKYFSITNDHVDGNGKDRASGFQGPFLPVSEYGGLVTAVNEVVNFSENKVVKGRVLPGVGGVLDGVKVYKKVIADTSYYLDYPDCSSLGLADINFTFAGSGSITASGDFSVATNIPSSEASDTRLVLCPVKNNQFVGAGVYVGSGSLISSTSYVPPANALELSLSGNTLTNGMCVPIQVQGRRGDKLAKFPDTSRFTASTTDPNVQLFYSSGCVMSGDNTMAVDGMSPNYTFFAKKTASGTGTTQISVSGYGFPTVTRTFNSIDQPGSIVEKINIVAPPVVNIYECYPFSMYSVHATNNANVEFTTSYSFIPNSNASSIEYHYGPDCTGSQMSSLSLGGPSNLVARGYFKVMGGMLASGDLTPALGSFTPSFSGGTFGGVTSVKVINSMNKAKIGLRIPATFEEGMCVETMLRIEDINGNLTHTGGAVSISLSDTGGGNFYSDMSCSSSISTKELSGNPQEKIYFKKLTTGNSTLSATAGSVSSAIVNVNVLGPTFSRLYVVWPGQTFNAGAPDGSVITGNPTAVIQQTSVTVQIYATKYDNSIDTSVNGNTYAHVVTGMGLASIPTPSSINFVNGVANVNLNGNAENYISISIEHKKPDGRTIYGSSPGASMIQAATSLNMYMSASAALVGNGCQIFAVIPENANHASRVRSNGTFTISTDVTNGTIYTDAACSMPVSGPQTITTGQNVLVYFFKGTSYVSGNITITPAVDGVSSAPVDLGVTVGAGSVSTMSTITYVGRTSTIQQYRCQPYLIHTADSTGKFVSGTAVSGLNLTVNNGAHWADNTCSPGSAPTSLTTSGYDVVYLSGIFNGTTYTFGASASSPSLSLFGAPAVLGAP